MAQSKEGQQRQAELKLSGNSQTSARALGSAMVTRHICRNYQHELTFVGKALPTEMKLLTELIFQYQSVEPSNQETIHEGSQIQLPLT